MDFEVLETNESNQGLFYEIENFFRNRRRQLQDWEPHPPQAFGWLILLAVSFELAVLWRMSHRQGLAKEIVGLTFTFGMLLLLVELALAKVGQEVAEFFKKKGRFMTAVSFLNIGLIPLLMILPLVILKRLAPQMEIVSVIAILVMITMVLANFREALEISFEFNKLQSALVLYLSGGFIAAGLLIVIYASFFSLISEVFSAL
jgi:hypothetical protein